MDLDLRKLRYFVVTAEELNFGRAAERLFIAQPVLSRQISALERELGVVLFHRSKRGTTLTDAGASLQTESVALLRTAAGLQRRARLSSRGRARFAIGCLPGLTIAPLIRRLDERFPEIQAELVPTSWNTQIEVVRDGRADVSVVRLPAHHEGITVTPLYSEPCVVALSSSDPLAAQERVTLAEIALKRLLQPWGAFPEWSKEAERLQPAAAAAERRAGPTFRAVEELFEEIADGSGIALMPESAAQFYSRPDIVFRYVDGHPPVQIELAYEQDRLSPVAQAALELASTTLAVRPATPDSSPR